MLVNTAERNVLCILIFFKSIQIRSTALEANKLTITPLMQLNSDKHIK